MKYVSPKNLLLTIFLTSITYVNITASDNRSFARFLTMPLATITVATTVNLLHKKPLKITKKKTLATVLSPFVLAGLVAGLGLTLGGGVYIGALGSLDAILYKQPFYFGLRATIGLLTGFCGCKIFNWSLKGAKYIQNAFLNKT